MACIALAAHGVEPQRFENGLAWLSNVRRPDGSVPVSSAVSSPAWPTGLAVLAWVCGRERVGPRHEPDIEKAAHWLLATRGCRLPPTDEVGHDTTLQGWPWVEGTHSWAEPTAYAILALRAVGQAAHPRVREGVRLLLDRTLPSGGWNYGNTRVFDSTLRPFVATTGIVLSALAGERSAAPIDASIAYLTPALRDVRSPLSVGWGFIGLTAWNSRPNDARSRLARCAVRTRNEQPNTLYDTLLLLAAVESCPLVRVTTGDPHG